MTRNAPRPGKLFRRQDGVSSQIKSEPADRASVFLHALQIGGDIRAKTIALVVAHPDDEGLALGAQLPRLNGLTVVHVTDGAPRNVSNGFATPEHYAAARQGELAAALALAGIPPDACVGFTIPDQEAALNLVAIARRLAGFAQARGIDLFLTHAYEGGHPDHDAVAFAVHAACALMGADNAPPAIVEMPFYHAGPGGWVRQRFIDDGGPPEVALCLRDADRALKARMFDAHQTQRETLSHFPPAWERFRPAPAHDFRALPNRGDLLYERYPWGMTGARWKALCAEAYAELGVPAA